VTGQIPKSRDVTSLKMDDFFVSASEKTSGSFCGCQGFYEFFQCATVAQ
jgi:hypothetical protein